MKNNTSTKIIRLASFALLLATFSWGSSFIALKHAVSVFDPSQVVFARMAIATICFLALYKLWRNQKYVAGDWKYFLLMSLAEPCVYFIFEAHALKYTTASSAGVINSSLPPLVAVAAWFFLRERISLNNIMGLGVSLVGVLLLSLTTTESAYAPNPMLGNTLEFCAIASSCVYVVILRKISARYSALFLTALQAFVGTIFFAPLAAMQPMPVEWSTSGMLAVAYLGIFVTLAGYFLFNWGWRT
jgi:drug/metabolite transporter (DMT)-like permease